MQLIQSRFEKGKYWAYGIFKNDQLVYSCWITISKIKLSDRYNYLLKLDKYQGLLEDAYCHPSFRGKELHSKMNLFRLNQLIRKGRIENFVVIVKDNVPALKAQLKSGFKLTKHITLLRILDKQFTFEKKIE